MFGHGPELCKTLECAHEDMTIPEIERCGGRTLGPRFSRTTNQKRSRSTLVGQVKMLQDLLYVHVGWLLDGFS